MKRFISVFLGISLSMVVLCIQSAKGMCVDEMGVKQEFVNRKLRQLVELMPNVTLPLHDSIMKCEVLPPNKSLLIRYNSHHQIEHLGVSLFSNETKKMLDSSICDFLERFFLELVLQESNVDVQRKLIEYHVRLQYDGVDFGKNQFISIYHLLQTLRMPVIFNVQYKNKYGLASWKLQQNTLSVLFPMSAELINGMDKKEADTQLYNRLIQIQSKKEVFHDAPICYTDLQPLGDGIYVKKGSSFLIPSVNSDVYYTKNGLDFIPIFTPKYPGKSLQTLFHTYKNGRNVKLLLTHRQYGHFTPEIELPLNNFIALFERHFEIFTATQKRKNGEIETMVVFHHKSLNYIHLLRVRNNEENLVKSPLFMKADFYSNIPQHYIKSLFNIK